MTASESFVAAVEAIYAAAAVPALWPDALQAAADCLGDRGAALDYSINGGADAVITSPAVQAAADEYNKDWWRQNIRIVRTKERGLLAKYDTITDRHVVTEEEVETHPFYAEYLAAHGLRWFAGTVLASDPGIWIGLAVHRAREKAPFNDDELALLQRLGHHVENALRLGIRLLDAEVAAAALGEVLSRLTVGVFLVDAGGRIVFANPAADRLLGDGLVVAGNRLAARFAPEREALEAALDVAVGDERDAAEWNPRPLIVHGLHPNDFLSVYVLPVRPPAGQVAEKLLTSARAAVVARPSNASEPADPALVRDLLGLTLGEARVASLVGSGLVPGLTIG